MTSCNIENQKMNENEGKQETQPRLAFPYEIKDIDPQVNSELLKLFQGEKTGYVQVGPKKWLQKSRYTEAAEDIYNFKLRSDDVWVVTFPRSGTTLTQEIVWLMWNDLDYEAAKNTPLTARFPLLEKNGLFHRDTIAKLLEKHEGDPNECKRLHVLNQSNWTKAFDEKKGHRFIKTHLPFSLLPPNLTKAGPKVIYVGRNPKDVVVSFYEFNRSMLLGYTGDFPTFYNYFEQNLLTWGPYWEHLKEGWAVRHEENVLFIFYEELNAGLRQYLEKIASFLGKAFTSEELDKLADHLKIDNMRNNKSVNGKYFPGMKQGEVIIRKGKTGGWKNYFDKELEERADRCIEENLKDTDLRFPEV